LCDRIVYVDAPRSTRLARLGPARGWNEDELARRELAQMSLAEKQRLSHATLDNGGTLEDMHARIGQLIRDWKLDNP
jgi:dephospho-CoA kinase